MFELSTAIRGKPFTLIDCFSVSIPTIPLIGKARSVIFQFVPPFEEDANPTLTSVKGDMLATSAQQIYTSPFGPSAISPPARLIFCVLNEIGVVQFCAPSFE